MTAMRLRRGEGEARPPLDLGEANLIERCRQGDQRAWIEFFKLYDKLIRHAIVSKLPLADRKPDIIEDIMQNVRIEIARVLTKHKSEESLNGLIVTIAQRRTIDWVRTRHVHGKGGRQERWVNEEPTEDMEVLVGATKERRPQEETAMHRQLEARLQEALTHLPERLRQAWTMFHQDGLTLKQIGQQLGGVTEGRISQLVSEAEARLSEELAEFRKAA